MRKYLQTIFISFVLSLASVSLQAQDVSTSPSDTDKLLSALSQVGQLAGAFTQRQFGQDDTLLQESTGRFQLLRPGYFSWEIETPDSQLIIADPQYLWHHDRDLETVTRRPANSGAQMAPLQILGGDEAALRGAYDVVMSDDSTFTLTPRESEAGFQALELRLNKNAITGMTIRDNLEQKIEIEFTDLDTNVELAASDFAFVAPSGADLFYYDQ